MLDDDTGRLFSLNNASLERHEWRRRTWEKHQSSPGKCWIVLSVAKGATHLFVQNWEAFAWKQVVESKNMVKVLRL